MKRTHIEQETVITYNRAEDTAQIYTADPTVMTKLSKLCKTNDAFQLVKKDKDGKTYTCPKTWIKIVKPREISEEQREALAERMRKMREAKQ